jgi:stress response protein SCP2
VGWDFFISYTGADREWAEWIAWELEAAGYSVLFQEWDFVPGSHWTTRMRDGIQYADHTLAILSNSYLDSVFGAAEWQAAYRADPRGFSRRLIPIRVEDCPRPDLLGEVVSFDLFGHSLDEARDVLMDRIWVALAGRAKPATAPAFPGRVPRFAAAATSPVPPQQPRSSAAPEFPGPAASEGPPPEWAERNLLPSVTAGSSVLLRAGDDVSLTTHAPGITNIVVGFGWEVRATTGMELDPDSSAIACHADGKVYQQHVVSFSNLKSPDGAIEHQGDNLTNKNDGDVERILVNLAQLPVEIDKVVFLLSIYEAVVRQQSLDLLCNIYIRILRFPGGTEIARYEPKADYSTETAIIFGEIYRHDAEWKFRAIGERLPLPPRPHCQGPRSSYRRTRKPRYEVS